MLGMRGEISLYPSPLWKTIPIWPLTTFKVSETEEQTLIHSEVLLTTSIVKAIQHFS